MDTEVSQLGGNTVGREVGVSSPDEHLGGHKGPLVVGRTWAEAKLPIEHEAMAGTECRSHRRSIASSKESESGRKAAFLELSFKAVAPSQKINIRRIPGSWRKTFAITIAMSSAKAPMMPRSGPSFHIRYRKHGSKANANKAPEAGQPCRMPLRIGKLPHRAPMSTTLANPPR